MKSHHAGRSSVKVAIKLIIGLGNPGRKYEGTRHNVGFDVLELLSERAGAQFVHHLKWKAHIAKHPHAMLMKPQTFMNESGRAAGTALRFYKWQPEEVLVVYDDVALPVGNLRFRKSGSAAGHNGLKSLIQHFGSDQFPRLKIGIGGPSPGEMVGHVLGQFKPDERPDIENALARAADAVQLALSDGLEAAANVYNVKNKI
ncbi:aminoacyl-tRNA hydrolase [Rubritalea profundi]|uniref:Peptidyl-tRNA hydrolase n=1 Tax=Rubritalea profundi TaxID=1658618 RepID=A0A2S7U2L8_9BACT|nr:aminoacyl-tRNA hydrolase [Rubritalea profundi]PQJ28671.1 aminoacyl-tRNA hydrolase [Rubritalea profundi]